MPIPITGRIVVLYKREVTNTNVATEGLLGAVKYAFSDSTPAAIELISNLTSPDEILDPAKSAVRASAVSQPGLKGVVVATAKPIDQAIAAIKQVATVAAAFQDVQILAQQTSSDPSAVTPNLLAKSVLTAAISSSFTWPGCLSTSSRLVWVGGRCGADMMSVSYTAIYALSKTSNAIIKYNNAPCVLLANMAQPTWTRQRFGSCGVPPSFVDPLALPTRVAALSKDDARFYCSPPQSIGSTLYSSTITLSAAVKCGSSGLLLKSLQYVGVRCGTDAAGNTLVQWRSASASGCTVTPIAASSLSPAQVKWNLDVFGLCGVPPGKAMSPSLLNVACVPGTPTTNGPAPSPSPSPSGLTPKLPRVQVASGESIPFGVGRIEAFTPGLGVADTARILAGGTPVVVAVADSGVQCSHPDINCLSCKSWIQGSARFPDDADGCSDFYGHGTHVAGTVGARNTGAGVVGVSPNVGIISLKILDGAGTGSMSAMLSAMSWAVTEGVTMGIKVINLSLTTYFNPDNAYYADIFKSLCDVFQQASDAGIIVTAAAGNSGANMRGFFPATCPTVLAVSAVNAQGNGPSGISNWLPADSMTAEERASFIAAPGTGINSTVPLSVSASGYMSLSGTSMAAPHVAGIAANCLMAGDCNAPGMTGVSAIAVIQAAAKERYAFSSGYGFAGDAISTAGNKHYGYLAWAKF